VFFYVGGRKVDDGGDGFLCLSPWWWWWLCRCGVGNDVARLSLSCCTRERCCCVMNIVGVRMCISGLVLGMITTVLCRSRKCFGVNTV
jgi:hypothetical protein